MNFIHASYFSYVIANGNLGAANQFKVANERASIKTSRRVLEDFAQDNPNPSRRIAVGAMFEARVVLQAATQAEIAAITGGSEVSNVLTINQSQNVLPLYDTRFAVVRDSDGLIILKDITDVNFMPEVDEGYEAENKFYLPVLIKSTSASIYTSDNSA